MEIAGAKIGERGREEIFITWNKEGKGWKEDKFYCE